MIDAPRYVEQKVTGDMTLEWLRDTRVILPCLIAEDLRVPESVVLIRAAGEGAASAFSAHYIDSARSPVRST